MAPTDQDLRELLQMAALLKGAAARAVFRDCSATLLGVAELLERRALADTCPASPVPPPPPRQPVNITA